MCCFLFAAKAQVVGWQLGAEVVTLDLAVVAQFNVQFIGPVNGQEDGLQQVIAISAATGDVQKQIDLGGGGEVRQASHVSVLLFKSDFEGDEPLVRCFCACGLQLPLGEQVGIDLPASLFEA